jgi:hypothetical protein
MSNDLRRFAMAMILFMPTFALAAPGDLLEIKGQIVDDDPVDPVRQHPAKIHDVKLDKGKLYQIDLISDDFDSYLRLVNAAGVEVAQDDDGGGNLNSKILYRPTEDGNFKIYVTTFGGGTGNYVLKVKGPGQAVVAKAAETVLNVKGAIAPGDNPDPVRGKPGKIHQVKLKKGIAYEIDMMSKQLDSYLRLEDETGKEVASDDDSGEGFNARIKYTPKQDGTFKIYATTFGGGKGFYTLTVKSAGTAAPVAGKVIELKAPTADTPTEYQGQLQMNDDIDPVRKRPAKTHVIELKGGKTYVIDLVSNQFDSFLRIENADGQQLGQDDDSGGNLNARLTFVCPADGRYRIFATTFAVGQGQYELTVAEQP